MGAYGSRSRQTKRVAYFRHPRLFTDEEVRHLYPDLKRDKDGQPTDLKQYAPGGSTEDPERDAYVAVRRVRIGVDDEGVRNRMWHQDMVDWNEVRKRQADPTVTAGQIAEELEEARRTEYAYAKAEYFTVEVKGPYFRLPEGFTNRDAYGDPDPVTGKDPVPDGLDPDAPHELAGQVPPVSCEWFEVWDVALLNDYLAFMDAVHGGRSPEEEATFPAASVSADDAGKAPARRGVGRAADA